MATIVDRTPEGIFYRAAKTYPVPDLDLLTLLFGAPMFRSVRSSLLNQPRLRTLLSPRRHPDPHLCGRSVATAHRLPLPRPYELTSAALRKHFNIGACGSGKDIVSVISTGHYLLPTLFYGVIGAGGWEQDLGGVRDDERYVAVRAAEEAGWGRNGGGRVVVMSEGAQWTLRIVQENGSLGANLVNEKEKLKWEPITDRAVLENSLVVLIYSSGTTGLSKGVKLSLTNLVAEVVIPGDMFRSWLTARETLHRRPRFEYRTLAPLPIAHIAGIQGYLINPLYMGGPVYWMPRFSFPEFLSYNLKYRITLFFTVPPIYLLIAKSPEVTNQFATLEMTISGAAPLGKELQHAASAKLGGPDCFVSQTWGLSETTGSATIMPMDMRDDTGSVSPLIPNMLARIVDDEGRDVEPGKPGEVLVKGPVVCKGYFRNEAANADAFAGDWFHTGDVAEFREGLFYIVDRKKELIKYKGLQVAPAELEALLLNHEDILDAAVIGVDADGGTNEVPRAYVVADSKKISGKQIQDCVKANVASHKQLRGGVVFLDAIPKSPSGKILRKDLRVIAMREHGAKL
ncbi:hypothetical protein PMIN04_012071 [Paraphaeosphaeria minitans]